MQRPVCVFRQQCVYECMSVFVLEGCYLWVLPVFAFVTSMILCRHRPYQTPRWCWWWSSVQLDCRLQSNRLNRFRLGSLFHLYLCASRMAMCYSFWLGRATVNRCAICFLFWVHFSSSFFVSSLFLFLHFSTVCFSFSFVYCSVSISSTRIVVGIRWVCSFKRLIIFPSLSK